MTDPLSQIKREILLTLSHEEADEGLYFDNLYHLHEEDERAPVSGTQEQILEALKLLITDGKIKMEEDDKGAIFRKA